MQLGRSLGEVRYLKKSGGAHAREGRPLLGDAGDRRHVQPQPRGRRAALADAGRGTRPGHARDRHRGARALRAPARDDRPRSCWSATRAPGSSAKWNGDDRLRPLDETGEEQAEELVRLLSRFGVEEIVSADYTRCVDTVEPLSEAIGVPIRTEPLLSETGFPGHEEEAAELVRDLGRPTAAAVACSQGDVIPELIAAPRARGRRRGRGAAAAQEGRRLGAQLRRPPAGGGGPLPASEAARVEPRAPPTPGLGADGPVRIRDAAWARRVCELAELAADHERDLLADVDRVVADALDVARDQRRRGRPTPGRRCRRRSRSRRRRSRGSGGRSRRPGAPGPRPGRAAAPRTPAGPA